MVEHKRNSTTWQRHAGFQESVSFICVFGWRQPFAQQERGNKSKWKAKLFKPWWAVNTICGNAHAHASLPFMRRACDAHNQYRVVMNVYSLYYRMGGAATWHKIQQYLQHNVSWPLRFSFYELSSKNWSSAINRFQIYRCCQTDISVQPIKKNFICLDVVHKWCCQLSYRSNYPPKTHRYKSNLK